MCPWTLKLVRVVIRINQVFDLTFVRQTAGNRQTFRGLQLNRKGYWCPSGFTHRCEVMLHMQNLEIHAGVNFDNGC